jgi:hypothetical protein
MNNAILQVKIKQRLNKLDSQDYDNIQPWQKVEAFNKAQIEWCRRKLHGGNIYKEGDEASKRRIDDLQILLTELQLTGVNESTYFRATNFPIDEYLEFKRVSAEATSECCPDPRSMTVYLAEEANVNLILRDPLKRPDFDWGETFCTLINNEVRIYKDSSFNIVNPIITFYKKPTYIQVAGVLDPYTNTIPAADTPSSFKDDVVELMIDEAAAIIAGDIANYTEMQRAQAAAERSN